MRQGRTEWTDDGYKSSIEDTEDRSTQQMPRHCFPATMQQTSPSENTKQRCAHVSKMGAPSLYSRTAYSLFASGREIR